MTSDGGYETASGAAAAGAAATAGAFGGGALQRLTSRYALEGPRGELAERRSMLFAEGNVSRERGRW